MKKITLLVVVNLLLLHLNFSFAQTVQTIIGTGLSASYPALGTGANGDGLGTAIKIQPGSGAICSDALNNIYFVDRQGKYIRKWNAATHQVTTVAGNGASLPPSSYVQINTGTLPGDGGLATNLNIAATSICVTADGHYLYFSEGFYETLRVIDLNTGIVNVVCGYNGGPAGGAVYCGADVVKDNLTARFARIATSAQHSLALDENNNLYVADNISNRRIRKILRNPVTGIADGNSSITTLAFGAGGIATATDGVSGYSAIPKTGATACTQPAGYGYLGTNTGGVDLIYKNNYIYFTELHSAGSTTTLRFRKMNVNTLLITTIRNEITTTGTPSVNISGFAMDNLDNMYVNDLFHSKIYKVTQAGVFSTFLNPNYVNSSSYPPYAAGTSIGAIYPQFSSGSGISNDAYGNLIYVDGGNYTINKITICNTPEPISGSSSVCVGASINLSNATAGGVWSSIAGRAIVTTTGIVTGISAGTATIRYTLPIPSATGCPNFVAYNITVNANPGVPSIAYAPGTVNPQRGAGGGSNYCSNRTFTVVGFPAGGVWSATGVLTVNTSGVVNTGSVTGAGTLTYTNTINGCSNSRTIAGNIVGCASRGAIDNNSLQATDNNEQWTVYPNPARSTIRLQIEKLVGQGQIIITDLYGKQVKHQLLSIGTNTIDILSLNKGMYFISTITNNGNITKKFVVE